MVERAAMALRAHNTNTLEVYYDNALYKLTFYLLTYLKTYLLTW